MDQKPTVAVEVLDLGAPSAGRGRRFWLRVGVIALSVLILLAAGEATRRWQQATAPTFTEAEVAQLYASPVAPGQGTLNWDTSTLLLQKGGGDVTTPGIVPTECAVVVDPDNAPVSIDVASVNLAPLVRPDGGQVFSGTIVTYRYARTGDARVKYESISQALGRCAEFDDPSTRFRLDQATSTNSGRARSDLSFRLDDTDTPLRVRVTRFGNTVTWITTAATVDSGSRERVSTPDLLVDRLQGIYRAR